MRGEEHPRFGKHLSDEAKKSIGDKNRGRIKTQEEKQKRLETMNEHGGYGWWIDDSYRKKLSESNKGKNTWAKGSIWINNGIDTKMIHEEDLASYEAVGWRRGRLSLTTEQKEKISRSQKGTQAFNKGSIRMNKDGKNTFVSEDKIEEYLSIGWERGWK